MRRYIKFNDTIFSLVKSLDLAEKRFLKSAFINQNHGKKSNSVLLFNILDKQKEYSRKQVKKLFMERCGSNNISVARYHLYRLMIKSLVTFHFSDRKDNQLQEEINHIKILYTKKLFKEADSTIQKAKRNAYDQENYYGLPELLYWEKRLIGNFPNREQVMPRITKAIDEQKAVFDQIAEIDNLWIKVEQMNNITKLNVDIANRPDLLKRIEKIVGSVSNEIHRTSSSLARFYWSGIHMQYAVLTKNSEAVFLYSKREIEFMEGRSRLIQAYPWRYLTYLSVYNNALRMMKKYNEALSVIRKMKSEIERLSKTLSVTTKVEFYSRIYIREMNIYAATFEFNKIIGLVPEIVQMKQEYKGKIVDNDLKTIQYNIAYGFFCTSQYRKALRWVNDFTQTQSKDAISAIDFWGNTLLFLIHYELGNYELLTGLMKKFKLSRPEDKRMAKIGDAITRFIEEVIPLVGNNFEFIKHVKALIKDFRKIEDEEDFDHLLGIDVLSWLRSKVENKPFVRILKERSGESDN
ncbi:MAG: hypothetical protein HYU69_02660 [Bacteroidetes bacterium]|nr:hypothetical protein [Bacteroidota bacterium]